MMKYSKDRTVQTSIVIGIAMTTMTITSGPRSQIQRQQKVAIDHAVEQFIVVHHLQLAAAAAAAFIPQPPAPRHRQPHADHR